MRCVNVRKQIANVTSEKSETDDINKMSFDFGVEFSQDSDRNEEELVNLVEECRATNTKKCTSWGLKIFSSGVLNKIYK